MIDVYFMLKKPKECVGGVSLREFHPEMKVNIWQTYKVYPVTEKTVLFKRVGVEFCTNDGKYEHEMGRVTVKFINDEWLNVNVRER